MESSTGAVATSRGNGTGVRAVGALGGTVLCEGDDNVGTLDTGAEVETVGVRTRLTALIGGVSWAWRTGVGSAGIGAASIWDKSRLESTRSPLELAAPSTVVEGKILAPDRFVKVTSLCPPLACNKKQTFILTEIRL